MNPYQWLDEYEARLADLKQKSADLQENFAASQATVSSKDGSVTITVGPNGGLLNLQLGYRATELGSARLTALIMETAKTAQRQAAHKVLEVFEPLGEGTQAMSMVMDAIPADENDTDENDTGEDDADYIVEIEEQPVAPPAPPAHRQASAPPVVRRSRPAADEDDDNNPW